MDAALAEQLERLADWMIGGAGVLCALVALRAASGGSWPVRLILGPVAVGSVLAAFFALLIVRPPIAWQGTVAPQVPDERPTAGSTAEQAREGEPGGGAVAAAPRERGPEPDARTASPAKDGAVTGTEPVTGRPEGAEGRTLLYATDRGRADRDGQAGYGSQPGGRLELGRVQVRQPRRSAMARAISAGKDAATSDAGGGEAGLVAPGAIAPLDAGAWREELARLMSPDMGARERHAVVVVHGFDTAFEDAAARGSRLAERVRRGLPVIVYSWPSGSRIASYSLDRDNSARAAPFLGETVISAAGSGGAEVVSLAGFGLGCRTLLEALGELAKAASGGATLGEVVLVAPDLEAGDLARRLAPLKGVARGITIYADGGDHSLDISRRFNGGVLPGGGVSDSGPLVLEGVTTIDATGAADDAVVKDIALLLSGERDPGGRRLEKLSAKTAAGDAAYWRFTSGR